MKRTKKYLLIIILIIVGAVGFFLLGSFLNVSNIFNTSGLIDLIKKEPALVEQIPFGEILEVIEFKETGFYDSTNEFIGAEIMINVKYLSIIEPHEKLPKEYKSKQTYSNVNLYVKEIPSQEVLEKLKKALADNKYLKLNKGKEIHVSLVDSKIGKKRAKKIKEIFVQPDSYHFLKY